MRGDWTHFGNARQGRAGRNEAVGCLTQLLNLVVREGVHPSLRVVLIVLLFPYRHARDVVGKLGVGEELVGDGRVLARGADAVGEDVAGGLVVLELDRRGGLGRGGLVNEGAWCHGGMKRGGNKMKVQRSKANADKRGEGGRGESDARGPCYILKTSKYLDFKDTNRVRRYGTVRYGMVRIDLITGSMLPLTSTRGTDDVTCQWALMPCGNQQGTTYDLRLPFLLPTAVLSGGQTG